jgi:hypothetical protein
VRELQSFTGNFAYKNFYAIDASALDSSKFYFIGFGSGDIELDCEIHSPNVPGASAFNQNRIHFLLTTHGWSDAGVSFTVLSYNIYAANEVTIGAIVRGNNEGNKGVYVRGGLLYRIKCNATPVLYSEQYTFNSEIYPSPVNIDNWEGTNVMTIWTYQQRGPYFREKLLMGSASVIGTTPSTSPTTGALVVAGGAGIAEALNVGGIITAPIMKSILLLSGTEGSHLALSSGMIQVMQGGVVKAEIKLAMAAGVLSLLASGLPFSCEGVTSTGDIKAETADPAVSWTAVSNPKFGANSIYGITYGDGKFVAVGNNGKAAYSTDGINWTAVANTTFGTNYINAVAYNGGKFIAVGGIGKAAYSADGTTWTAVSDPKFGEGDIFDITYGGGKFVAVGVSGKAAYSTDGINWTAVENTTFGTNSINGIAYGSGNFAAVGSNGKAAYSTDGITWTAVAYSTSDILDITYGGGKFVAGGNTSSIKYSTDGITWTAVDNAAVAGNILSIAYGGGKFVAVANTTASGNASYSTDGINWTAVANTAFGTNYINDIAYGGGKFVAVGSNGKAVYLTAMQARLVFNANGTVGWVKA